MTAPTIPSADYVSLVDAINDSGITFRQADTWVHAGHIHVAACHTNRLGYHQPTPECRSGHKRLLTPDETRVLSTMARLVRVGLTIPTAAHVARALPDSPFGVVDLDDHISVVVLP